MKKYNDEVMLVCGFLLGTVVTNIIIFLLR